MGNDRKRQSDDSDWGGEPAEDAERQRGEGRGLDEPEKQPPPPDLTPDPEERR